MRSITSSRLFWLGLICVFLTALLPRLHYPSSRFLLWYDRSQNFWQAIRDGELEETYQQYHPGVTTMWVAGLGMEVYRLAHRWSPDDVPSSTETGPQGGIAQAAVVAMSLVIAACISLVYFLLTRTTNWLVAFSGGILLALDPFFLTHSKMIHVDAFLAIFMLVSAVSWLVYLKDNRWVFLILSGVFASLAFLTKSPSFFLVPFIGLVTVIHYFTRTDRSEDDDLDNSLWANRLKPILFSTVAWALIAGAVTFLLWPALWTEPLAAADKILAAALQHTEEPHPYQQFFAGRIFTDGPGPFYYLATLAWKLTLVTLPAVIVAFIVLIRRRKSGIDDRFWYYLIIYMAGFLLMMVLATKKWGRYILPVFLVLDLLAALGLVEFAHWFGGKDRFRSLRWLPTIIVTTFLILQAALVIRHHPYYGTHHNLLLGGSQVAQHILPLGEQGEGLDLAAGYLNSLPGVEQLRVAQQDEFNLMFSSNFDGQLHPFASSELDFVVIANQNIQRDPFLHHWQDLWSRCRQDDLSWTVSFDGVPYVWVCPAYPQDPASFNIDHRLNLILGDLIELVGFDLSSDSLSAGDIMTTTLYWQAQKQTPSDLHVFLHLTDDRGQLVAQADGVPVQGEKPTWRWLDSEVIIDGHSMPLPDDLGAGTYTLSVGLYDFATLERLPVFNQGRQRLPEDRIVLYEFQVSSS